MHRNPFKFSQGDLVQHKDGATGIVMGRVRSHELVEARPVRYVEIDTYTIVSDAAQRHWCGDELDLIARNSED
jgi:hypothetical protein